jgi:YVTN family beta-propeller protein
LPYESFNLGIKIEYPSSWQLETRDDQVGITFRSPEEYVNDPKEYLQLYVLPISDETLDYIVSIKEPLRNLTILDNFSSNISNRTGKGLIYNYTDDTFGEIKGIKLAIQDGDKAYVIQFLGQATAFDDYLPIIEKMIRSLEILKLKQYVSFSKGFSLTYPSTWNKTEDDNTVIFSPSDKNISTDRSVISIASSPANKTAPFAEVINGTINDYEMIYPQFLLDNSSGPISFSEFKSPYTLNFSFTYDTFRIHASDIISIENGKEYHILYYTLLNSPSKYDTITNIVNTFVPLAINKNEYIFFNNTGVILQHPVDLPWNPIINGTTINLMEKADIDMPKFTLTVTPYAQNNFTKLDTQNSPKTNQILIKTNLGKNITANIFETWNYNNNHQNITSLKVNTTDQQGNLYLLKYVGEQYFYNKYLPFAKEVINSLKLIEPIIYNETDFEFSQVWPISNFTFPNNWTLTELNPGFRIDSPLENPNDIYDFDPYSEFMVLTVFPAGVDQISDAISRDLNSFRQNFTNFQLIESNETTFLKKPGYKIIYTYFDNYYENSCYCEVKVMSIYTKVGPNFYTISYYAELAKYSSYLPVIEKVINSMNINAKELTYKLNKSGIPLNGSPVDLAVNPVTNKLYVAIPESRQIQVIDGPTDRIIHNITIGAYPNAIAINPVLNRIFVASPETDIIYVIDGNTNEIVNKIQAGTMVGDINVDTNEFNSYSSLIFVANQGNNSVSIIDDVKGKVVANVKTGIAPFAIGVDPIKNRAYVTRQSGIDIIDYNTNMEGRTVNATYYGNIPMGNSPTAIIVNSNTSKAYISDSTAKILSVIDTTTNHLLYNITVGLFPNSIAFNPSEKKIYISNTGSNTVSIIDSTVDKSVGPVPVDSIAYDVAVNPRTNMIYMANYDSKTISTINGTTNEPVSALTFHVNPPDAGYIECNGKKISQNRYVRIEVGKQCNAISNYGFVFTNWSPGAPSNSTDLENKTFFDSISTMVGNMFGDSTNNTKQIHTVSAYGENTANFTSLSSIIQVASPFLSIGALILVTLVAVIRPDFTRWRKLIIIPVSSSRDAIDNLNKDEAKSKNEDEKILLRGEILTIDATVIIGVLIFLSFEGFDPSEQYQINIITASIVFPFAISAIMGVTKTEKIATRLMIAGFINLMISVILIAILKL